MLIFILSLVLKKGLSDKIFSCILVPDVEKYHSICSDFKKNRNPIINTKRTDIKLIFF